MAFDSKITFEKHLRSVSRAASQRLGILMKSWLVFHNSSILERCFRGFVLPVLEYCYAVWCSAADIHLKLLERAVSGARFLTEVCLSVTLLIVDSWQYLVWCIRSGVTRCTLIMVLPGSYVQVRVTRGALVTHRYTYEPPRCRIPGLLFLSQCPSGTMMLTSYSMVWDWRVSRAGTMHFYWHKLLYHYYSRLLFFPFSSFCL